MLDAVRALTYAPSGFGGLVATQWIEDGAADQIAASREQFEALLHRNAALLGIREVNATQPLRWQAMQ